MTNMQVRIITTTTPARAEVARSAAPEDNAKPPVSSISISSDSTSDSSYDSLSTATKTDTGKSNNSRNTAQSSASTYRDVNSIKTRTAERLSKASNKSTKKNRSQELEPLKEKYETFCRQLKPFVGALKSYHSSVVELEKNRAKVLEHIELFTENTPLKDAAGKISPIVAAAPQSWAKTVAKREQTYCALGQQSSALDTKYAEQVEEHCVEYVREWEMVVTTRINSSIAKADEFQKTVKHYEKKVEQLQGAEAKQSSKGKTPAEKTQEKLTRNQEKLAVATEEFDQFATTVCHLIDSVLDCTWRDMTPVLFHLANAEHARMGGKDSQTITSSLNKLVLSLKDFAEEHKIAIA